MLSKQQSFANKESIAMRNPFVHVELMSTDVGEAKDFYGNGA